MGKAYRIPSAIDRLRKQQIQIREMQALQRNRNTPRPVASTAFAGVSAAGSQGGTGNFLRTAGDTMIGPLALAPPVDFSVDIDADGILDIGESSSNSQYSSNIQIEDVPTSTTLDTIKGAAFDGQILIIRTFAPGSITIAQATDPNGGNIQNLSDADVEMGNLQTKAYIFDASLIIFSNTGGTWREMTGGGTGGGDVTFPIRPPVTTGLPTTGNVDLDLNQTSGHYFTIGPLTGNIDIDILNPPAADIAQAFRINIIKGVTDFTVTFNDTLLVTPIIGGANTTTLLAGDIYDGSVFNIFTMTSTAGSGGAGDASQWSTFPALQDVNFATFDGINIDRARFVSDSASAASPTDPSIYLDGASNMVFNLAGQKQWFWTLTEVPIMTLDQSGVNNDTILTVETDAADASALPFIQIFRDDPTPQIGLGTDSEITNLTFIGTNAATDGGAAVGNTVYAKTVSIYESVITGREAASVNFFTTFDTGATSQLKSFLGLNNSNSEQIDAFVDLNMQGNRIVTVSEIQGDDTPTFQIGFDTSEDSDTFMSSRAVAPDRVDMTNNGFNAWLWAFDTTLSEVAVGLVTGVASHFLLTDHTMYIDKIAPVPDANLALDQGSIFFDNSTDPGVLKIKKKDSGGSTTIVSLEQGGGTGANVFLSNLDTTTAVNQPINMLGNALTLDVDKDTSISAFTDDEIVFATGGSLRMQLENTALLVAVELSMQNLNKITNVNDPTNPQDVVTQNFFVNNAVTNPLTTALNMNNNDITNIDDLRFNTANMNIISSATILSIDVPSNQTFRIRDGTTTRFTVVGADTRIAGNSGNLGFFGTTPVAQQSVASDTTPNLYTALRAYGIIA